jgi:hypothetical protein
MSQPDPLPTNAQVARTDHDLLIAMNTKLDIVLTRQEDQERRLRDVEARPAGDPVVHRQVDDHEKRLRGIEAERIRMLAYLAASTVAASGGGYGLVALLGH